MTAGRRPSPHRARAPEQSSDRPAHPALAAALLMIGIVVFLVLVSFASVR